MEISKIKDDQAGDLIYKEMFSNRIFKDATEKQIFAEKSLKNYFKTNLK